MKKNFVLIFAVMIFSLSFSFAQGIPIYINNEPLYTDAPAVIRNGRTMVPVGAIGHALKCKVVWNAKNQGVVISKGSDIVRLAVGSRIAYINEQPVNIDQSPVIINSRTMVPLSFISKSMKEKVRFDPSTMSVFVDSVNIASAKAAQDDISLERVIDRNTYEMNINGEKKTVILGGSMINQSFSAESASAEAADRQGLSSQSVNTVIKSGDISINIKETLEDGSIIADIYIDGALLEVLLEEKESSSGQ